MDRMESSSRQTLSLVFQHLGEWRKTRKAKKREPLNLKWSQFHLSVVHGYLLKLNLSPDSLLLTLATLLNLQFSYSVPEYSADHDHKVVSFIHALQEIFVVPQQHQLFERKKAIEKSGIITAFVDVLLRLLHSRSGGTVNWIRDRIDCLGKDLRFLLAVLGDESFICSEDLLEEFEAMANQVGSLIHLIIFSFSTKPVEDESFVALLRSMDHLKSKIIKSLKRQKGISEPNHRTRNTAAVDSGSLFIVDSLIEDLEDLLSREDGMIVNEKDQLRKLHQELKLSNSFIKNPRLLKSKEYLMRIREVAYEAEYLINSFMVENASCRYFSTRLSHVIRKIKSVELGIQGSGKNFEVDVPKFSQLSLQNKSSSDVEDVICFEEELKILQYLEGEEKNLQIISICGMPGVGKTTLAKKLYSRPSFKDKFDICSWCVVSQRYQLKSLLIDILVNLDNRVDMEEMLNTPETHFKLLISQSLYKRRYLIVMDNMWSSDAWKDLQACFPDDGNRSRILFTSRNKNVAPSDSIIYELPLPLTRAYMDRMESSSRQTLSLAFEHLGEWRKTRKTKKRDPLKFRWSQFHLSVIHGYVLKLSLTPHSLLLALANLLNQQFSIHLPQYSAEYIGKVASFMHALKEIFVVPQQPQMLKWDKATEKSGLVAAFMEVLLRLLHSRPGSVNSIKDRIDCLRKDLRFLHAVLGHEFFICSQDMLAEFEVVANKVGSLVHLIIFSTKPVEDEHFGALLRRIDHLKSKIIKSLKQQQGITEANHRTRNAADVNARSLFIIDSLLDDLEDRLIQEDAVIVNVKDQIRTLQQELKLSNSFIKSSRHSKSKEYLKRIREVAYEADYLINSFLVDDVSCRYFSISISHVIRKIKSVEFEIQDVSKFSQLSLQNNSSDVEDVIGFEEKELEILQYLEGGEENLQIVSICGMPGVGKTTLAKKLYRHPSLQDKFDICSWCVVSQRYQLKSLLIDILVNLDDRVDREEMLNIPEEYLKLLIFQQHLHKRRYLIVMDDVWSSDAWKDLQACFPNHGNRSRILVTSRNKNVDPSEMKIDKLFELPLMSAKHCWELLRKKVFHNEPCPPHLQEIGVKIAASCHGLPLAVVVIAGILTSMNNQESTWKMVEGNLASYILGGENNLMMKIVQLSYDNLVDHLKPCFLYFGVFRQGKKIFVAELLKLWIAEGFICKEDGMRAESIAEDYLKELINRSLVSVAKTRVDGGVKACDVHDLLHEFCMRSCQEENLQTSVDTNYSINTKHQRFCIRGFDSSPRSPLFGVHVRSIFGCFPVSGFLNMKLLRVLVLQGVVCYGSLNEIKLLTNLRCLAIGYGSPSSEPEVLKLASISTLVSLEFLQLKSQFYLVCIPSAMAKMMKLRHININTLVCFGEECSTISQTNNLEFLYKVIIRDLNNENMLKCSPNLRGLKCKCFPFMVEETGRLRYPDFSFFTQLESLHLEGGFPRIIADISLPLNVKELTLSGLYLPWEKISEIGRLQNLQNLKLLFDAFDGEVWETRGGEFEQLRFLSLKSVYDLKAWKVESWHHFPRLQRLMLDDCQHLPEIPAAFGEIETLVVVEIKGNFQETLKESARKIQQQQKEDGNEELNFNLNNIVGTTSQTASSFFSFLL